MKLNCVAVLSMLASGSLLAQDIHINGTISQTIKIPVASAVEHSPRAATNNTKKIKLLKLELSDKAKQNLANRATTALQHTKQFAITASPRGNLPAKVDLGMNNVPVMDQGNHGTCVTFATTAAIDAVMGQGDYISQVCQLQLGNYLAQNGYGPSGWDGSWGRVLLNQMEIFGIVNKQQEAAVGCGGFNKYPTQESDPVSVMSLEEYHQLSEPLNEEQINWSPILDAVEAMYDRLDTNKTLTEVKATLAKGDRLTFGVLLLDFDLGTAGAVGTTIAKNDTWVLTPEIARDVIMRPNFGGHEMIITGYDDNAITVDDQGRQYKGLLKLRNSWSDSLGDKGDFYMTYDFFKLLVLEVQSIRLVENTDGEETVG